MANKAPKHRGGFDTHPILPGEMPPMRYPSRKQSDIDGQAMNMPPMPPPNLSAASWWPGLAPARQPLCFDELLKRHGAAQTEGLRGKMAGQRYGSGARIGAASCGERRCEHDEHHATAIESQGVIASHRAAYRPAISMPLLHR